jgi:UDP-3-O-[3-hydroxymyristoyl] glucosamine N-acyltransferase
MNLIAKEIAEKLNGTVVGDVNVQINKLAKIETAVKGSLTFLANPKYIKFLSKTRASIVLVSYDLKIKINHDFTLIRVADPYVSFTNLLIEFAESRKNNLTGIEKTAVIHSSAKVNEDVYIGHNTIIGEYAQIEEGVKIQSNCVIGKNVKIGKNTFISSRVSVLENCKIGTNCILHSGVVIGSDGFGFAPQKSGEYIKIPQIGNVVVKNNVEIGSNTTIDRATLGETIINDGVKLDNLVQIAHNVEIGAHTVIAAQSGVSGSTKIGKYCVIGGQAGIAGHLIIGDDVKIQGQAGVINNIPNGKSVQGNPAMDYKSYYKSYVLFKKFPDFESRLRELEKDI